MRSDPTPDPLSAGRPVTTVESSDGVRVAVHDLGGSGRPALLAHATGFHGLVWTPFARHLEGFRSVAPDLRGHGRSPLPAGVGIDWDGFADDVLASVDALGLDRPVGIGHSKGGAALLRAEARRPGTFSALWCYEPIVFPPALAVGPHEDNPLAAGAERRRTSFGSFEEALANFAAKPPLDALAPEALEAYVRGGFEPSADGSVHLRCRPEVEAEVYRTGTAHDTFTRLSGIGIPVTIARGAVTPQSPAQLAEAIAAELPAGHLVGFDDLGHFGPLEDPARTAAHAADALRTA